MAKKNLQTSNKTRSFGLVMTGMVIVGLIGFVTSIGIFWGKDGLLKIGLGVLTVVTIAIMVLAMSLTN